MNKYENDEKQELITKQNIFLLGCGGTIGSVSNTNTDEFYHKPNVSIQSLLSDVPDITQKINIHCEQISQLMSQEMTHQDLLNLAKKIDQILKRDDINGIVITQGTNCIEEVAYFVNLVVNTEKPIVFTGALRPFNSLGFDGIRNIYNAILIASSLEIKRMGVVLTFNDFINSAREVIKSNPSSVNGLSPNDISLLGFIQGNKVIVSRVPNFKHTYVSEFNIHKISTLSKTYVIYGHLDSDGIFVDAAVANGATGIISAGVGKGYQTPALTKSLINAANKGIVVVRCSRTGYGYINRDPELDDRYGFIAGGSLSSHKARILLMVALSQTNDKSKIQNYFCEY